jgi:hypothetical protein
MNRPFTVFAALAVSMCATTAMAGVELTPITFTISMDSATFGDVTFSSVFDAEITESGPIVFFQSKAGDWTSDSPFPLSYTGGSMLSGDITFMGFGSAWDGNIASGTGVLSVANFSGGGFTPESVSMTWSITNVPAPGMFGLLGVAGLARRRRRD